MSVSIVLPTYNRAHFLPQAFEAIQAQTFADWELIVVDDGSTDGSRELCSEWLQRPDYQVQYIHQKNSGPAIARNTGIDAATGRYLAFFDSDDYWLPHHLNDCVCALESNPDCDWVYGAYQRVERDTGRVLSPSSFYDDGVERPLLNLSTTSHGPLSVFNDSRTIQCAIDHGLFCGFHVSMIRSRVFDNRRLPPFRVGEDQAFTMAALADGVTLGYLNDVHQIYYVHSGNISLSGPTGDSERRVKACLEMIRALEWVRDSVPLEAQDARALRRRLSRDYFWLLGYGMLWQQGWCREAFDAFNKAIQLDPWNVAFRKTQSVCRLKRLLGFAPQRREPLASKLESLVAP